MFSVLLRAGSQLFRLNNYFLVFICSMALMINFSVSTAAYADASVDLLLKANAATQKRQHSTAIKYLQRYLKDYPDGAQRADVHFALGSSYMNLQKYEIALQHFDNLEKEFPRSKQARQSSKPRRYATRQVKLGKKKAAKASAGKSASQTAAANRQQALQKGSPFMANLAGGSGEQARREENALYEKGRSAYNKKQYDAAESAFTKIIQTSRNSILVSGAKTHLELVDRGRKDMASKDIGAVMQRQGVKSVDMSGIVGEALFSAALKSWAQHQDADAMALLEKYIEQGDAIERSLDAHMLLLAINSAPETKQQQMDLAEKVMKKFEGYPQASQAHGILMRWDPMRAMRNMPRGARNASAPQTDYSVLRRVDGNFRMAVDRNTSKYLPSEKSYKTFTDTAPEDIVTAFYQRADKYRAFFRSKDNPVAVAASPAKQGQAYEKLIQPLSTGFDRPVRAVYDTLEFTATKNTQYNEPAGLELSLHFNAEAKEVMLDKKAPVKELLKHHLKTQLLSQPLDKVAAVKARYTFYSDYQPHADMMATYQNAQWTFDALDISNVAALEKPPTAEELQRIEDEKYRMKPLPPVKAEERSQKEILALLKPIRKKLDVLLAAWDEQKHKPLANLDRRGVQSDMVDYVRDEIKGELSQPLYSALMLLQKIDSEDVKKYRRWDRDLSKQIRTIIGDSMYVWDEGFNQGAQSQVNNAYGFGSYMTAAGGGTAGAEPLLANLLAYQYEWIRNNSKGTIADVDLPMGFSGGEAKITYKEPVRFRARLDTPTEIFFEGLGQQAGQAGAAFLSYMGQLKQFEQNIVNARKEYFECFPNCKQIDDVTTKFSRLLIEKDLYFLKLSDGSKLLYGQGTRSMSILMEGVTGQKGKSLIDGGIPRRCKESFSDWSYYYSQAVDVPQQQQMNDAFTAMGKFAKGNVAALQKLGQDNKATQQRAFKRTVDYYGRYQLCRDQSEFDSWEAEHGELKPIEKDSLACKWLGAC